MSLVTQVVRPALLQRLVGQRYTLLHAVLLAVGLALFVVGNTHEGVWLDESYTAAMVKQTPVQILGEIIYDNHPPLYYLALLLFVTVTGHSVFSLHLFSALGALGLAALGVGPIRRATSPRVGLLYTFLVIATPGSLTEGQEARMYSWAACLVTGAAVYAFLAGRDNDLKDWALFGLFSLAAAYTHYYALLAVVLLHGLTLVWLARHRGERLRRYVITSALVGLAYLPWLIPLSLQTRRVVANFWVSEISLRVVQDSLLFPFGYKWGTPPLPQSALAFGLVALLALGGCVYAVQRQLSARGLALVTIGVYALLLVSVILVSYIVRPVLTPRYMTTVMGLLLLPAAYGLAALPRRAYRLLACGVFLVLMVPILVQVQRGQFNGPWLAVVEALRSEAGPDAVFVHANMNTLGPLAYYFPAATHILYRPGSGQRVPMSLFGPHVWFDPQPQAVVQERQSVWLVGCNNPECSVVDEWLASQKFGLLQDRLEFRQPFSWQVLILARIQTAPQRH